MLSAIANFKQVQLWEPKFDFKVGGVSQEKSFETTSNNTENIMRRCPGVPAWEF